MPTIGWDVVALVGAGVRACHTTRFLYDANVVLLFVEPLSVDVDATARVVINERTGTVVVGGSVRLGPAAVAHGNLSVKISTRLEVSQPEALSKNGVTAVVPQEQVDVNEGRNQLLMLEQGSTLESVVRGLNALGASPRDHPVEPGRHLFGRLAARHRTPPDGPVRVGLPDLLGCEPLEVAVVPLREVVVDLGVGVAGEEGGVTSPPPGRGQDQREPVSLEPPAQGLGHAAPLLGERQVGGRGVPTVPAPLGLTVPDRLLALADEVIE